MNCEFAANKISVANGGSKTITLQARNITLATRSFGPATLRAVLEADLSNGEKVITAADQLLFCRISVN